MTQDYKMDLQDQRFILKEQIGLEKLLALDNFKEFDEDTILATLEESSKFCQEVIAPTNRPADRVGAQFNKSTHQVTVPEVLKPINKKFYENGWIAVGLSQAIGGMGLPKTLEVVSEEHLIAANAAYSIYPGLSRGVIRMIEKFGTPEQKSTYLPHLVSGRFGGTMCLSEPQAGSAVGDLKSTAKRNADGTFNIKGSKCWISYGDHDMAENIIHLVLARIEGAVEGTKGISLFVVPKFKTKPDGSIQGSNDVVAGNIEHKLGIHASPTCVLNFGENNNCVGTLISQENQGMRAMFEMMNDARIDVAIQGVALGNIAYLNSLEYARNRVQGPMLGGGSTKSVEIINHPDVKHMLSWMKANSEGMRSLLYKSAFYTDMAKHHGDASVREKYQGFIDLLTPIIKSHFSDVGFEVATKAVQIYGGSGYVCDYPVEQYLRDCKISSIYEGTNGIQALDFLGRKLPMKNGAVLQQFFAEITTCLKDMALNEALSAEIKMFGLNAQKFQEVITKCFQLMQSTDKTKPDAGIPFLHATRLLKMAANLSIAACLLEQSQISLQKIKQGKLSEKESQFYTNKIETTKFFINNILIENQSMVTAFNTQDVSAFKIKF